MHPLLKKPRPELVNDILMNMGMSHVILLVLLDVSAAFDTVDPSIFFLFLDFSQCSALVGQLFNGFDPI